MWFPASQYAYPGTVYIKFANVVKRSIKSSSSWNVNHSVGVTCA